MGRSAVRGASGARRIPPRLAGFGGLGCGLVHFLEYVRQAVADFLAGDPTDRTARSGCGGFDHGLSMSEASGHGTGNTPK
jgi:hypothetical protein